MSMRDKFSPRPDDFGMGKKFRSRHPRPVGWLKAEKRGARRASRHGGAKRAIAEGLAEAGDGLIMPIR